MRIHYINNKGDSIYIGGVKICHLIKDEQSFGFISIVEDKDRKEINVRCDSIKIKGGIKL